MDGSLKHSAAAFECWDGCYDGSWKGLIVPDAFCHPAKFARGLVERIILTGFEEGWWKAGDVIGDPFGGVMCGGIVAAYAGLGWVGVELEPRFVGLAHENFYLHVAKWMALRCPLPTILQGDSRRFAELVGPVAAVMTRPPYVSGGHHPDQTGSWGGLAEEKACITKDVSGYGQATGQIGQLRPGCVDAAITSPPFADSDTKPTALGLGKATRADGDGAGRNKGDYHYPNSAGQIGVLPSGKIDAVVTSPPYACISPEKSSSGVNIEKQWETYRSQGGGMSLEAFTVQQSRHSKGYGASAGQIGTLPAGVIDGAVTSPPFGEDQPCASQTRAKHDYHAFTRGDGTKRDHEMRTDGNVASLGAGETYWLAMRQVYAQLHAALRPGARAVVVLKDYVKKGQRVPLADDTIRLMESLGFDLERRYRAMLVKERHSAGLFGMHIEKKSRKSFFRRMAENKGSPRIDWEDVIVMRKCGMV